jgi:hypothetical protein
VIYEKRNRGLLLPPTEEHSRKTCEDKIRRQPPANQEELLLKSNRTGSLILDVQPSKL